jgi:hypothetical protein
MWCAIRVADGANKSALTLLPHRLCPSRQRLGVDGIMCLSILQISSLVFLLSWRDLFLVVSLAFDGIWGEVVSLERGCWSGGG